jgi:hypothetical protein
VPGVEVYEHLIALPDSTRLDGQADEAQGGTAFSNGVLFGGLFRQSGSRTIPLPGCNRLVSQDCGDADADSQLLVEQGPTDPCRHLSSDHLL